MRMCGIIIEYSHKRIYIFVMRHLCVAQYIGRCVRASKNQVRKIPAHNFTSHRRRRSRLIKGVRNFLTLTKNIILRIKSNTKDFILWWPNRPSLLYFYLQCKERTLRITTPSIHKLTIFECALRVHQSSGTTMCGVDAYNNTNVRSHTAYKNSHPNASKQCFYFTLNTRTGTESVPTRRRTYLYHQRSKRRGVQRKS